MTRDTPSTLPGDLRPRTRLVHAGTTRSQYDETSEALYMTSGYVYGSAEEAEAAFAQEGSRYVYSRFRNPTVAMFEDRMADYEGAERAWSTASGMAAVFAALLCQLQAGDRVVAPHALFGSCLHIVKNILPRYGIETTLVDGTDAAQWRHALSRPAKVVLLETPSNPMLDVVDIPLVAELAHAAGARLVVDNVFATPVLQKPLELGADVVVYSATKHIDGQGRCLAGVVLGDAGFADQIGPFLRHTGPVLSPFNAWLLLKGLETLELRVEAQTRAAQEIAEFLETHPRIRRTAYPGLPSHPQYAIARAQMTAGGPLVAFDLDGGKTEAFATLNGLRVIRISNNLGDAKSLLTHPATTTHQRLTEEERARVGISPGSLRLSVGLEHPADLIADLDRALASF
ncbi:O-succinylhomoserine sulfhydrylase [Arenibaculum sp.]|jgi:O-succinylhomoserine sulfhydrylase|uniref:O-succinylhomoserine sulfhydrylase n=1 Tax=Arenibaculum sp. TaxID=2865862 RepID=UPI002E13EA68|nr:O-succinylhomoserine sulfhydrylase [Arenibaculum sp.]